MPETPQPLAPGSAGASSNESAHNPALDTVLTAHSSPGDQTSPPASDPYATVRPDAAAPSQSTYVLNPAAGTLVGVYRLDEKLGEGGMGAVWKAFHVKLKKHVALKLLPPQLTRDATLVARFEREMEAVGRVDSPHVVRAMDAGEFQGLHYLVMEYVDGVDFNRFVKDRGPQPARQACELIRQAALGLAAAHKLGLVHRDIKPANLFLTKPKDGAPSVVKILDLGLARLGGDTSATDPGAGLTGTGNIMGTPDFMAPEQWGDTHRADGRADLYALGCTLHFLLTGRAPYAHHAGAFQKMAGHVNEPIPDLRGTRTAARESGTGIPASGKEKGGEIPDAVVALFQRLMAKKPDERMQTADELAKTLLAIVKDLGSPSVATAKPPTLAASATPQSASQVDWTAALANAPAPPVARPKKSPARSSNSRSQISNLKSRILPPKWLASGVLAVVMLLAGIIIRIRNKDGSVTEIKAPDGAQSVEIEQEGKTVGKFLADTKPAVPSPAKPAAGSNALPAPTGDPERDVAAWVISKGGVATVYAHNGFIDVRKPGELPRGPLVIDAIKLAGVPDLKSQAWPSALRELKAIRWIAVHGTPVDDRWCEHLRDLTSLEYLGLSGTRISDAGMPHFKGLTRLEELNLAHTQVSERGIAELAGLPRLWNLSLNAGDRPDRLNDRLWPHLAKLPRLESLEIYSHTLTNAGLRDAPKLPRLSSLRLLASKLLDHDGLRSLPVWPELRMARFDDYWITADDVEAVLRRVPVAVISLSQPDMTLEELARLQEQNPATVVWHSKGPPHPAQRAALEWLLAHKMDAGLDGLGNATAVPDGSFVLNEIHANTGGPADPAEWQVLRGVRTVEQMQLRGGWLTDAHLKQIWQALGDAPQLTYLVIVAGNATGDGFDGLAAQTRLSNLAITMPRLTDAAVAKLAPLKRLNKLDICGPNQLTDQAFATFATLPELHFLHIGPCEKVTGRGLKELGALKELTNLGLAQCPIEDDALAALPDVVELDHVDLTATPITDAGLVHLAGCRRLRKLFVEATHITAEGIAKLQQALPKCTIFWDGNKPPDPPAAPPQDAAPGLEKP